MADAWGDVKLGRNPSPQDHRTLMAAKYLVSVPAPPAQIDYGHPVSSWEMALNDQIGCCTISAITHQVEVWTRWTAGRASKITDADVLKAYEAISGYNPADPSTDQGANELRVLKYWRKHPIGGHQLQAFAALNPQDQEKFKQALWVFGGCYLGLSLPVTAQQQRRVWDVVPNAGADGEPGSWGGHAVDANAFSPHGVTITTWGQRVLLTWDFFHAYCQESWAWLSLEWLRANKSPEGFDLTTLEADLGALS